jgi:hypothetical protein
MKFRLHRYQVGFQKSRRPRISSRQKAHCRLPRHERSRQHTWTRDSILRPTSIDISYPVVFTLASRIFHPPASPSKCIDIRAGEDGQSANGADLDGGDRVLLRGPQRFARHPKRYLYPPTGPESPTCVLGVPHHLESFIRGLRDLEPHATGTKRWTSSARPSRSNRHMLSPNVALVRLLRGIRRPRP